MKDIYRIARDRLNEEISESHSVLMPWLENDVNEVTLIAMQLADTGLFKPTAPAGIVDHINPKFLALLEQIEFIRDNAATEYINLNEESMAYKLRVEMAENRADWERDCRMDERLERKYA
jgi:hypothetical protein